MGGGQLGRMWAQAAQRMGYATAVLDPDAQSPAGLISHHAITTPYDDPAGLAQLAQLAHAITTEFENVPAAALEQLARLRPVAPSAACVAVAQDRAQEKAHFERCLAQSGVTVAPYASIQTPEDLQAVPPGLLPGILKTARMGYDGKGQVRVANPAELQAAWAQLKRVPCVLEQLLPLVAECSVLVARGADGSCVHFPVQRNLHRNGILAMTEVYPGNVPADLAEQAVAATRQIAQGLNYVGVLCVEFFVLDAASSQAQGLGRLVVNEMAPRPHNSGHYTLDACDQSQFDLQVRTMAGLPLMAPRLHSAAIMLNLLGDLWLAHAGMPPWDVLLALPGTHLHLYGKTQARAGRKMGHLNITAATPQEARAVALQASALLGLPLDFDVDSKPL
jgi:5-(carboxyamino)imidazole ribonucleotide synthase